MRTVVPQKPPHCQQGASPGRLKRLAKTQTLMSTQRRNVCLACRIDVGARTASHVHQPSQLNNGSPVMPPCPQSCLLMHAGACDSPGHQPQPMQAALRPHNVARRRVWPCARAACHSPVARDATKCLRSFVNLRHQSQQNITDPLCPACSTGRSCQSTGGVHSAPLLDRHTHPQRARNTHRTYTNTERLQSFSQFNRARTARHQAARQWLCSFVQEHLLRQYRLP